MPASPTRLPRSCAAVRDVLGADRHDRGQRLLDDRRDRHQRLALVAGEQHLGLVGDRDVDLAGREQLQRQRRVGRHLDVDVETGLLEVALGQRLVDADVVGVGEPVEHQRQRLRACPTTTSATPSSRRRPTAPARAARRRRSTSGSVSSGAFSSRLVGPRQRSRSARVSSANSAIANSDRITTAAYARAVSSCGIDCWNR